MNLLTTNLAKAPRHRWALLGISSLAASSTLWAADSSWNTSQNGLQPWDTATNWVGSIIPGASTASTTNGDTATFGTNTAATTVTVDTDRNIKTLQFNGTNVLGAYTIGDVTVNTGGELHLSSISSGSNINMLSGAAAGVTINAPIILEAAGPTLAGTHTISNNARNDATAGAAAAPKLHIAGDISGGATTQSITLTLAGSVGNRSGSAIANVPDFANTISGVISDGQAASLSLYAHGGNGSSWYNAWYLSGLNTYTGKTAVGTASLYFNTLANAGVASSLGMGDRIELAGGTHLVYIGTASASTDRTVVNNGGAFYNNSSGTTLTLNGAVTVSGTATFRGSGNITITSVVSGSGGVSHTNGSTLTLSNVNTFSGNINVAAGTVSVNSVSNNGVASAIGAGSGNITFGQNQTGDNIGKLQFTGASGGSMNRSLVLNTGSSAATAGAGATLENTVAGQRLTLSGTIRANSAPDRSYLELSGAGNGVISGVIGGTTSNAALSINLAFKKTGTGIWELSGANNFASIPSATSPTNATIVPAAPARIEQGTLLANNTSGSALGSGSVLTVASSGATLGGTGSVTGGNAQSITISAGTFLMVGNTHQVAAGTTTTHGYSSAVADLQLGTASNVALTLAGTLQFDIFANDEASVTTTEADRLILATTASTLALGGMISVADVSGTHAGWTSGVWQLIDWSGASGASKTGSFTYDLPTASLAEGYKFDTSNFLIDGTISIVMIPEPSRALLMLGGLGVLLFRRRR